MNRIPPPIQPPSDSLLACLPPDLPGALRKKLDTALAGWRDAVAARDAAVAELARLSEPLPPALSGKEILEGRAAAERQAQAAAIDFVQATRRLALAFADALPYAERCLEAATAAVKAARTVIAKQLRGEDLLLSDSDLATALEASPEVHAAGEAEQTAASHRGDVQRCATRPPLQLANRWVSTLLGIEPAAAE